MKLGKAMKKLKFWSKKYKKPKNNFKYPQYYPPPPPPPCQSNHSWLPPQPSAPPMPPWYVPDEIDTIIHQSGDPALGKDSFDENASRFGTSSYQRDFIPEKLNKTRSYIAHPDEGFDKKSPEIETSSYQQYFLPEKLNETSAYILQPDKCFDKKSRVIKTSSHRQYLIPERLKETNAYIQHPDECFDKNAAEIETSSYQQYFIPEKLNETNAYIHHPDECFDQRAPESETSSYQQDLVEDPEDGAPLLGPNKMEKSAEVFGCGSIGKHLIQLLFGCFTIHEKSCSRYKMTDDLSPERPASPKIKLI